jgi:hypothetical protein
MKTRLFLMISLLAFVFEGTAQTLHQTIRGRVIDQATQTTLPGATIILEGTTPPGGTTTDMDGNFILSRVPVGRQTLVVSFMGYNPRRLADLIVTSSKEVVLEIGLSESVNQLNEVVVRSDVEKDKSSNSMAMISARTFSVEESRRYAGGMDDPARMASAFAGVAATGGLQDNAVIIRGNAPGGVLWRVEGVEVPNPNHFSGGNVAGGGFVSILSAHVMANSDFYTGAFPAEYGNALAGVFDIKLKTGNNKKREHTFQMGMHGVDLAAEGPFRIGHDASYVFNYRYSTFGLLSGAGLIPSNQFPLYQDLSFKMNFPTRRAGTFSLWGMGGIDKMDGHEQEDPAKWEHNMDRYRNSWNEKFGAGGVAHKLLLSPKTWINSGVTASGNLKHLLQHQLNPQLELENEMDLKDNNGKITLHSTVNHKFSARHTNRTGFYFNTLFYNMDLWGVINNDLSTYRNFVNDKGHSYHTQFFSQSRYMFSDQVAVNLGFHAEHFALNNSFTVDPRAALNWQVASNHRISLGYGKHSKLENLKIYLVSNQTPDGLIFPNKDLSFSHAHHFVMGYDWNINRYLRLKIEPWYQYLYDIPGSATGSFSMINFVQDFAFMQPLVNNSVGINKGIDVTFEQFMKNNFYYLVTASVFDSKYKAGDEVWRNSRYNKQFVANALAGKEFVVGKSGNSLLGINGRVIISGGDYTTPLMQDASDAAQKAIFDDNRLFEEKNDLSVFANIALTFRTNRRGYSSVWSLQMNNVLGTKQNREYVYNYKNQQMEMLQDQFVIPGISWKIEF